MATQAPNDPAKAGMAPGDRDSTPDDPARGNDTGGKAGGAHGLTESQSPYLRGQHDERAPGASASGRETRLRSNYVSGDGDALAETEDSSAQSLDAAWNGAEARTPGQRADGLREPVR
jgi:hypothetical protein